MVAEGVTAAKEVILLKERFSLHLPILEGLYAILFQEKNPMSVLDNVGRSFLV